LCRHKNFLGVNANRLGILLRVRQGITFHFETIPFFVSPKILIFIGMKIRILDFGKKIDFFVNLFWCNLAKTGPISKRRTVMDS